VGTPTNDAVCKGGCSALAAYSYQIATDLWICAYNKLGSKTWVQTYSVCDEANHFYLATVAPMTRRGLPTSAQIGPAMTAATADGFQYLITGQPARSCSWDSTATSYESCNGLGYIATSERTVSGGDWVALDDGNSAEYRQWPAASPANISFVVLASLCLNSSADASAYVFDHRWR
jgi:hypothetical protein